MNQMQCVPWWAQVGGAGRGEDVQPLRCLDTTRDSKVSGAGVRTKKTERLWASNGMNGQPSPRVVQPAGTSLREKTGCSLQQRYWNSCAHVVPVHVLRHCTILLFARDRVHACGHPNAHPKHALSMRTPSMQSVGNKPSLRLGGDRPERSERSGLAALSGSHHAVAI